MSLIMSLRSTQENLLPWQYLLIWRIKFCASCNDMRIFIFIKNPMFTTKAFNRDSGRIKNNQSAKALALNATDTKQPLTPYYSKNSAWGWQLWHRTLQHICNLWKGRWRAGRVSKRAVVTFLRHCYFYAYSCIGNSSDSGFNGKHKTACVSFLPIIISYSPSHRKVRSGIDWGLLCNTVLKSVYYSKVTLSNSSQIQRLHLLMQASNLILHQIIFTYSDVFSQHSMVHNTWWLSDQQVLI